MNKIIIVTGAASGIGHHIAIKLQDEGHHIIAIDRENAIFSDNISFHKVDLCCENAVKNLFDDIPFIDCAINCAGISAIRKELTEFSCTEITEEWQKNFLATFNPLKYEILKMRNKKQGKIVNLASITADIGMKNFSAYATAKASIRILTKIAAIENSIFNIHVNSISPATIDTPMIRKKYNGKLPNYNSTYFTGHCGSTNDVFEAVNMFLKNNFLTGYDLKLDGGLSDLCEI